MKEESKLMRQSIWIWDEDYPYHLTIEELKNPLLALQDVFSNYSLKDCQYLLWEWKHCNYRPYLFSFGNGVHTLYHFMCKIQKLLNVAWLIDKEFACIELLIACDESAFEKFKQDNYCNFFYKNGTDLRSIIKRNFQEEDGLQGFMNVLRHWWDLGVSFRHLDDGSRCNVGSEIPEFKRLNLMIETMNFISKNNDMKESPNVYACSAYLSLEEGSQPVKTLMRIFSKWEYEELKGFLRELFYTMNSHGGLETGIMGDRGGVVHTHHKLIDLAREFSLKDDNYFEEEKHFTLKDDSELGIFWEDCDRPPFHHLSEVNLAYLINKLRNTDYELLHRNLHEFMLFLVGHENVFKDDYMELIALFQRLEELQEVLYLLMLNRVQVDW
ncbi:hypothetical protein ORI89_00420 [Sphingobacterium sp. UT-1RO-CII-1]|uniref:hypothetical protein n=1 Tax=Sphingobacterium sp. UT-1RO-CII-1 TaxID=2995225 RepID=UPI00227CDA3B|nr:hypothetical protein [Sphingobacterium sp. UT-1RO-CII-1]MCY4778095.1 hypothetical protein [Sphingobacterium sp. UT-1RO-CII-1]